MMTGGVRGGQRQPIAEEMLEQWQPPGENPEITLAASPIKFTGTPTVLHRGPPMHGEHTAAVLAEFGIILSAKVDGD